MIKIIQNTYGDVFMVNSMVSDTVLKNLIEKILKQKKLPFQDVYVSRPLMICQKFLNLSSDQNLNYKGMELKKNTMMIKF